MESKTLARDSSIDESQPLVPSSGEGSARSLNPDMVHPPLTPPARDYEEPGGNYELSARMITILRSLTIIVTLANIIYQLVLGPRNSLEVFLIVWDWFILIWCILSLGWSRFPSIGITVGNWRFQSAGAIRDGSFDLSQNAAKGKGRHGLPRVLYNVIDVLLALILIIFSIFHAGESKGRSWNYRKDNTIIDILHFFVL